MTRNQPNGPTQSSDLTHRAPQSQTPLPSEKPVKTEVTLKQEAVVDFASSHSVARRSQRSSSASITTDAMATNERSLMQKLNNLEFLESFSDCEPSPHSNPTTITTTLVEPFSPEPRGSLSPSEPGSVSPSSSPPPFSLSSMPALDLADESDEPRQTPGEALLPPTAPSVDSRGAAKPPPSKKRRVSRGTALPPTVPDDTAKASSAKRRRVSVGARMRTTPPLSAQVL